MALALKLLQHRVNNINLIIISGHTWSFAPREHIILAMRSVAADMRLTDILAIIMQ
jgi:hypothetical protein